MRYIILSETEKVQLEGLYKNSTNHVTRERCLCLLLSSKQHSMIEVSRLSDMNIQKITRLFNAWESSDDKLRTLSIASGRGAKVKLESVCDLLPDMLKDHERNLSREVGGVMQIFCRGFYYFKVYIVFSCFYRFAKFFYYF